MENKRTAELVILAALMHDIGKFAQRADCPLDKSIEQEYCKKSYDGNYYTHKHVLYGYYYLMNDFPLPYELEHKRNELARYASAHHNPGIMSEQHDKEGFLIEHIIQRADMLSSGLGRITDTSEEHHYKKAHLQSVFSQINLKRNMEKVQWHNLKALKPNYDMFPLAEKEAGINDYKNLFQQFKEDIEQIPLDEGLWAYISSLITQLEKYTYCIPSCTYKTEPDISLYDHSITTTAIAQALWHSAKAYNITNKNDIKKLNCFLFAAELSGIQKYIFTGNGGKGFTRLLRARSFHLQALMRSIILRVLNRLNLLPVAQIMDAGGKCILLLPDTPTIKEDMQIIMQEIELFFVKEFQGELKIIMSLMPITQKDMNQKLFVHKLDALNDSLELNKQQLFKHYFSEHSPIYNTSFPNGVCAYCETRPANDTNAEDGDKICNICKELINIGRVLPNSLYGLFTLNQPKHRDSLHLFDGVYLILDDNKQFLAQDIGQALDVINIKNRTKYTSYAIAGYIPKGEGGDSMTFEHIAKASIVSDENPDGANSTSMLGVLKADVDNLGFIFSLGFKDSLSVSRFAMLSRMLNTFFSEYLVQKIQDENLCIYTVFTGGDDLFVLGAWTDILKFASILHADFAKFTANNPNITLSAGIEYAKPKVPISTIARMAEEALEVSKKHENKNACTTFNVTCNWKDFIQQLEQGDWLINNIQAQRMTQGLVRRLLHYANSAEKFHNGGEIINGMYKAHLRYDLARNIPDKDENKELKDLKDRLLYMADNKDMFLQSRIAISYALYKTRI